jgi:hypothetical protein
MFKSLHDMACEDDANTVLDPLRMGFLGILGTYLVGGIAMIVALLHAVWFRHDMPVDFQAFGIGFAAWAAGGGTLLTGAGAGVMMKSKGDAMTGTTVEIKKTVVPPDAPITQTTTTTQTK